MIQKKYITIALLLLSLFSFSQNKVCTSSHELEDLNTIGKCAIENFKTSKNKEFIQVSSRSRYVRRGDNSHLNNLRKHLKTVPKKKVTTQNTISKPLATSEKKSTELSSDNREALGSSKGETIIRDFLRFDQVNKAPAFITCNDSYSNEAKESCNKETFVGVILENLVYPFDAAAEGVEGKVWVRFIIDKEGYVKNITTKGPENGDLLEKEAERLVKLLPKFLPGKDKGEYANVEYFMPIEFHLD